MVFLLSVLQLLIDAAAQVVSCRILKPVPDTWLTCSQLPTFSRPGLALKQAPSQKSGASRFLFIRLLGALG